jgi:hypothetical protein
MSFSNERTHFFHANATAIGGYISKPLAKIIPVQSPTSLSPSGGADEAATATTFQFEKIMSAKATRSRVEGSFIDRRPTTRAMAVVEDLNVLDEIRVDELFAYISSVHPGEEPDVPIIKFGDTAINGLRIGDALLKVHLDTSLLELGNGKRFPKKPHLFEKSLWKRADEKFEPDKGFLKCSLVEEIEVIRGKKPNIVGPNTIDIPNIGRMHLAELLLIGNSYQLIMMRLELGCPTQGSSSNAATIVNGKGGGP